MRKRWHPSTQPSCGYVCLSCCCAAPAESSAHWRGQGKARQHLPARQLVGHVPQHWTAGSCTLTAPLPRVLCAPPPQGVVRAGMMTLPSREHFLASIGVGAAVEFGLAAGWACARSKHSITPYCLEHCNSLRQRYSGKVCPHPSPCLVSCLLCPVQGRQRRRRCHVLRRWWRHVWLCTTLSCSCLTGLTCQPAMCGSGLASDVVTGGWRSWSILSGQQCQHC